MIKLKIQNLGPINEEIELELDKPVTLLVGETGSGKSFILRLLALLLKYLPNPPAVEELERDFREEFGAPYYAITEGSDKDGIALSYNDETIAKVEIQKRKFSKQDSRTGEHLRIVTWEGGKEPIAEYARNSIIAPDERVPLTRQIIDGKYPSYLPSEKRYCEFLRNLRDKNDPTLEEALEPLFMEGLLPKARSFFDRGIIAGNNALTVSSTVISFLSLAPVISRLRDGRALLAAVDTVEIHLTPLLQMAATINLARLAKFCWKKAEEHPTPLLIVTHSSSVLAALAEEIDRGIDDRIITVPSKYRLEKEDVKEVVLYHEEGVIKCKAQEGIVSPQYLREYLRLL